jgi:hypothetical protein
MQRNKVVIYGDRPTHLRVCRCRVLLWRSYAWVLHPVSVPVPTVHVVSYRVDRGNDFCTLTTPARAWLLPLDGGPSAMSKGFLFVAVQLYTGRVYWILRN